MELDEEEKEEKKEAEGEFTDPEHMGGGSGQRRYRVSRKHRKHKKYSTNIIMLTLKFCCVLTILQGYFLLTYFQSESFLKTSMGLVEEAEKITLRSFSNHFLYQVLQEILATQGQGEVLN